MKSKSELVLKIMRFVAWIAFIGLLIKAGAIIMAFGVSIENPEAAKDLYRGMDLSRYETYSFVQYAMLVSYHILVYIMLAYIALFATKLLSVNNIEKLCTKTVANLLKKISVAILGVFILAIVHNAHVAILEKYEAIVPEFIASECIFLAGIVYVLAELFKRSVEIQMESELTD